MRQIVKDSTNQTVDVYIIDATTGIPETGVLWNTAGIDLKFHREGEAVVSITEAALTTPALTDAHEDGGFLEIGNGVYRLDLPDAAFATGAELVTILGTVTGMIVVPIDIQLTGVDVQDPTPAVDLTAQAKLDVNAECDTALTDYGANTTTPNTVTPPTVSQLNARTLLAAAYFDPSADAVANVTLVATTTTNTDMVGTDGALLATTFATMFTGMTELAQWLGLIGGKQTPDAQALTEIKATGEIEGSYDPATDSIQAIREHAGTIKTETAAILADTAKLEASTTQPAQGAPSATASPLTQLNFLFKAWRNRSTQTATEYKLYADDTTTVDQKATVSSDGTTTVKGEMGTGA